MKKGFLSLFLQLCAVFLMAQTNYYVSADLGTDGSNFGLSPNTPFRSLNYAVDLLEAGDTLNIMEGIYYNDAFGDGDIWKNEKTVSINNKNGTPDAYIVIRPYQNQSVTLRGDGLYIFHIRNSSYIRVEGLEIEGEVNNIPLDSALAYQFAYRELGSSEILYRVQPGTPPEVVENLTFEILDNIERPSYYDTKGLVGQLSHHIDIVNNHIHHTPGTGLRFNSSGYMNIIGNEVHDCSRRSYSGTHALVLEACDDMNNSTDTKIWISRNHIHDNYNEIYSWSPSKTIITPIIDEGKGISLQRNDAERGWTYGRIRVENNLTHHNGFSGLHSNTGRGIDFINNTSYHDSRTGNGNNHGISLQNTEDVRIINNIVVNDTSADGYGIAVSNSSSNYLVDHNLVLGTVDADVEALATNMLYDDPLFIDPTSGNFGIAEGSPAIDAALASLAPSLDFAGQPRGNQPDLGAFEFAVSTAIKDTPSPNISIYPNPFTNFLTIESTNSIQLFDVLGREVTHLVRLSPNAAMTDLDTSILEKGFYVLVINATTYTLIKNQTVNTSNHKIARPIFFQAFLLLVLSWILPHSLDGQNTLLPGDPTFLTGVSEWQATGDAQILHASEGANTPGAIQLEVFSTNGNIGNATLRSTEISIAPAMWGKMLFFNYYAKGQNGNESFRVRFTLLDQQSGETQQQSTTLTLPTGFREYSMPVYLPENTHKIQVQFQCGLQTGQYFFDDMSLAPAGVDLEDIQQFDHWQSRQFTPPTTQPGPELQSGTADVSVLIHTDEAGALVLPTQFGVNSNFRSGNDLVDRSDLYQSFGAFRFPAGSGSNRYFWDCDIPDDFAIEVSDICGTASQSLSPENFVTFKDNANGEATVVVNYFYARYGLTTEGTRAARVQQAADYAASLVQYLNVELNAGIRYWEIGNECYGPWETGYEVNGSIVTGKEYGEDLRVFAEAMKAVDPNIWIGAVLSHKDFDWNNQVLPEVQDHADFLIVHHYFEINDANSAAQSLQEIANDMQEIQIAAAHYTNKPPGYFPVAFTEFNIQGPEATNIINGLFVAEALATVVQQKYTMSTIWVNEWNLDGQHSKGLLAQNDPNQEDYTARPSYTPFYYFDRYFGDKLLDVSLTGNESVRAYASKFSSGEIGLLIVNYGATAQRVNIDFSNPSVTADRVDWHTVHANSQQAGDMKFYVNGQTGNTPGGGPTSLGSVPAFTTSFASNKQLEVPKLSATYLALNTNISTATGSVEQAEKQELFPNPTTGWVTIDTDGDKWGSESVQVFGADGKKWNALICIEQQTREQISFDLSALPVGLYFLQTPNGTKSIIKK